MKEKPLIVISGPSGSGKNTIIENLKKLRHDIEHSISTTTRPPRSGEQHGVNYYFTTNAEFEEQIKQNAFLEYARVLDQYYGTSRAEIQRILDAGKIPILDIDVQGALQIKKSDIASRLVFIMPPSLDVLRQRLTARGTETAEQIKRRLKLAEQELEFRHQYDYIIVNNELAAAVQKMNHYLDSVLGSV